jgi:hypothetical protein
MLIVLSYSRIATVSPSPSRSGPRGAGGQRSPCVTASRDPNPAPSARRVSRRHGVEFVASRSSASSARASPRPHRTRDPCEPMERDPTRQVGGKSRASTPDVVVGVGRGGLASEGPRRGPRVRGSWWRSAWPPSRRPDSVGGDVPAVRAVPAAREPPARAAGLYRSAFSARATAPPRRAGPPVAAAAAIAPAAGAGSPAAGAVAR